MVEEEEYDRYFFIDEDPHGKPPLEYRFVLGPHSDNSATWEVMRCGKATFLEGETDWGIFVVEEGDIVPGSDRKFQALVGQLVRRSELDATEIDMSRVIDLPPQLLNVEFEEQSTIDDDSLARLSRSVQTNQATTGDVPEKNGGLFRTAGRAVGKWLS